MSKHDVTSNEVQYQVFRNILNFIKQKSKSELNKKVAHKNIKLSSNDSFNAKIKVQVIHLIHVSEYFNEINSRNEIFFT